MERGWWGSVRGREDGGGVLVGAWREDGGGVLEGERMVEEC